MRLVRGLEEGNMYIAERLRHLRKAKDLSQGDVEKRTGLLRCYISRVENGHTVPAIETLEKIARALEIPLYQLFYEGEEPPAIRPVLRSRTEIYLWGDSGHSEGQLKKLTRALAKMKPEDRSVLMQVTRKCAQRNHSSAKAE